MSVFEDYARCYNLLYRDKDYGGEMDFVDSLIKKHTPGAESILKLAAAPGAMRSILPKTGGGSSTAGTGRRF